MFNYENQKNVDKVKKGIHKSVKIWDYSDVVGDVTIGEGTVIGRYSFLYGKHVPVRIGKYCQFMGWHLIDNGATFGDNIFVGAGTQFTTTKFPKPFNEDVIVEDIVVEDGVVIGANCTILPGVTIGKGSIIGGGSVVSKDIPLDVVAFGNPARVQRPFGVSQNEIKDHESSLLKQYGDWGT